MKKIRRPLGNGLVTLLGAALLLFFAGRAKAQDENFGDILINGRGYLRDTLTIPFEPQAGRGSDLDDLAPIGLRILTELQLSLVSAPFVAQVAPGAGLELAAFRGWLNFQVFGMFVPFTVHFPAGSDYLFASLTEDGGADVRVLGGFYVGVSAVQGIFFLGLAALWMDNDSFLTAQEDRHLVAAVFSLNPVALLRLFGGTAWAATSVGGRPRASSQQPISREPAGRPTPTPRPPAAANPMPAPLPRRPEPVPSVGDSDGPILPQGGPPLSQPDENPYPSPTEPESPPN